LVEPIEEFIENYFHRRRGILPLNLMATSREER
jgi:hypothetical protein